MRDMGTYVSHSRSGKSPLHCMERGFRGEDAQLRYSVWVSGLLVVMLQLAFALPLRANSTSFAARLAITHSGVEIRRVNTGAWLPLPENSESPFGPGDMLRTDESGRALLTFLDQIDLLILPESTYELLDFTPDISARITGHAVHRQTQGLQIGAYRLEIIGTAPLVVTRPAEWFAVWPDVLTVAEGEAEVAANEASRTVAAGQGIRVAPGAESDISPLESPLNAARLIGLLDGCPGEMDTVNNLNVNVRFGSDLQLGVIGNIPNATPVSVMGVNQSGNWYRIQAFSGFGWVQQPLVANACSDLPILPDDQSERSIGIFNVLPLEIDLLAPFYGPPEGDLWFYRSLVLE
jgi:Bacterial SH3 domain